MVQLVNNLQPYATVITALLSLTVLGFIIRLFIQTREIYNQRVTLAKEQTDFLKERLDTVSDELKRVEKINSDVTKIGASLGVEGFKDEHSTGVQIGDVSGEISGKIAGRDINEIVNEIEELIDNRNQNIEELINRSNNYITGVVREPTYNDYFAEVIYHRSDTDIRDAIQSRNRDGWIFCSIAADYNALDGAILIFRRPTE